MNSYLNNNERLIVHHLTKSFAEIPVLDNISLQVNTDEFVSVLGISGSGKSTILNIISGLLLPDSGDVIIDGQSYTGITGRVSYMYQKDLLLPWKRIIDNVSLPLRINGRGQREARIEVAPYFEIFGLAGFESKYPFQLSGGMRQRAALMRTFFLSRDILLLDEPFSGLDAITRSKMNDWLLEVLMKLKSSVLLITHDIEEAVYLSDRIYVLSDRPARIKEEIVIDLPKPRTSEVKSTARFQELKKWILNSL